MLRVKDFYIWNNDVEDWDYNFLCVLKDFDILMVI